MAALSTNANGDLWSISSLTVPAAGCMGGWVYPTDNTARLRLFSQFGTGADVAFLFRGDLAGDLISCYRDGTTYADAQASSTNFSTFALNTWMLWLFTWSTAESPKLWIGNLTTPPVEPSAYSVQTTLVSPFSVSGTAYFANELAASARYFRGRVASWFIYPSIPDQTMRYRLWRGEIVPGATYFGLPGMNGTTNVPDVSSGNRTGTITSLDVAQGPPLVVPYSRWEMDDYVVAAAVGGQPMRKRHGGIPGMRVGGPTFGGSWAA